MPSHATCKDTLDSQIVNILKNISEHRIKYYQTPYLTKAKQFVLAHLVNYVLCTLLVQPQRDTATEHKRQLKLGSRWQKCSPITLGTLVPKGNILWSCLLSWPWNFKTSWIWDRAGGERDVVSQGWMWCPHSWILESHHIVWSGFILIIYFCISWILLPPRHYPKWEPGCFKLAIRVLWSSTHECLSILYFTWISIFANVLLQGSYSLRCSPSPVLWGVTEKSAVSNSPGVSEALVM